VSDYNSGGQLQTQNVYELDANGSYNDNWSKPDGSYGSYWWNESTGEYDDFVSNSNGTWWDDDYQFASGGSPATKGYSFTESYYESDGSNGTRQYDAASGATNVSWYSSQTGTTATGNVPDSGFYGLQADEGLTNTQQDPTFFNPSVSPSFQLFLAQH
jgi:hypothetical protein